MPNISSVLWGHGRRSGVQRSRFLRKKAWEDLRLKPPDVHLVLWHQLLLGVLCLVPRVEFNIKMEWRQKKYLSVPNGLTKVS